MRLPCLRECFPALVLFLLCSLLGCRENPGGGSAKSGVASVENGASQNKHADVSSDQLLKIANDKLDADKYEEAIQLFTELAERSPSATNQAFIGDCYWKQRQLEQADIHYRQALEIDPKHCGANHALGRDAVLLQRYQEAIPYLDTASKVCAGTVLHAQNLRFRVEAFLELNKITDAESDFEELMTLYPENPHTYQAGILVARKKGDEALAAEYEAKLNASSNGTPK